MPKVHPPSGTLMDIVINKEAHIIDYFLKNNNKKTYFEGLFEMQTW